MMVGGGGHGWILHLPVSDNLTADGRRLEGRGER